MKTFTKTLLATTAALLLVPTAFAQNTTPWSVEIGAGRSKASVDCAGTIRCDDSDTFARAIVGYEFAPDWSVEFSVARLGRIEASAIVPPVGRVDAKASLRSIGLGVAGNLPLNDSWSLTARLGLASNKTSLSGNAAGQSSSDSETNTAPYAGLALNYALNKTTSLGLTADRTRAEFDGDKSNVTTLGVAARFRF